ncbi:hypothetical protein JCM5353_002190 [Sporobolomyces roseus]
MTTNTKEELQAIIDKALAQRIDGNNKFKAGDLQGALRDYHYVLLSLKGLDGRMSSAFGPATRPPEILPSTKEPKIEEIDDEAEKGKEKEAEPQEKEEESPYDVIKTALLNTHINSAAIHIKLERFQRALECAQAAQKLDEKNQKASFREAQARIGLGQIPKGKAILEEMQKTNGPDAGISQTLAKLAADEKEKDKVKNSQFRGMFKKDPPTSSSASSVKVETGTTATESGTTDTGDNSGDSGSTLKEVSQEVSEVAESITEGVKQEVEEKKADQA